MLYHPIAKELSKKYPFGKFHSKMISVKKYFKVSYATVRKSSSRDFISYFFVVNFLIIRRSICSFLKYHYFLWFVFRKDYNIAFYNDFIWNNIRYDTLCCLKKCVTHSILVCFKYWDISLCKVLLFALTLSKGWLFHIQSL